MKLSVWAKSLGITYAAAWRQYKLGQIPNAYQLPTGTIIVPDEKVKPEHVVVYARVSSSENRDNLQAQARRVRRWCLANGWQVHQVVAEVGSGLNDHRQKLNRLLEEAKMTKLVVEHRDRLTRFGFQYLKLYCQQIQCQLIVINETPSKKEDLISDFVAVITSFCARIYGLRRKTRKTAAFIAELEAKKVDTHS